MANKKKTIGRMNKKLTTNKRINEQTRVSAIYKKFRLNTTTTSTVNRVASKMEKFQQSINSKVSNKVLIFFLIFFFFRFALLYCCFFKIHNTWSYSITNFFLMNLGTD